jgi:hypothetical protein
MSDESLIQDRIRNHSSIELTSYKKQFRKYMRQDEGVRNMIAKCTYCDASVELSFNLHNLRTHLIKHIDFWEKDQDLKQETARLSGSSTSKLKEKRLF